MKIVENLIARRKVIEAIKPRFRQRSGWHVSELICCPRKTYFRRIGEFEFMSDETALFFTAGRAYHDILEYLPFREVKVEKDGIKGTIDLIADRVTEIFTTRSSSKRPPDEFEIKIEQLKSYLCMTGRLDGDLMVFYIMGDYKDKSVDIKVWTLSFEPFELEVHWDMILDRKRMIEECIKNRQMPKEVGKNWECKRCGFKHICGVRGGLEMMLEAKKQVEKELSLVK